MVHGRYKKKKKKKITFLFLLLVMTANQDATSKAIDGTLCSDMTVSSQP